MTNETATNKERVIAEVKATKTSQANSSNQNSSFSNFRKTVLEKVPVILKNKQ